VDTHTGTDLISSGLLLTGIPKLEPTLGSGQEVKLKWYERGKSG
jgi:hypothetical protein